MRVCVNGIEGPAREVRKWGVLDSHIFVLWLQRYKVVHDILKRGFSVLISDSDMWQGLRVHAHPRPLSPSLLVILPFIHALIRSSAHYSSIHPTDDAGRVQSHHVYTSVTPPSFNSSE